MLGLGPKKSLSSPRLELTAQGMAQCTDVLEPSVIPLSYQGDETMYLANTHSVKSVPVGDAYGPHKFQLNLDPTLNSKNKCYKKEKGKIV